MKRRILALSITAIMILSSNVFAQNSNSSFGIVTDPEEFAEHFKPSEFDLSNVDTDDELENPIIEVVTDPEEFSEHFRPSEFDPQNAQQDNLTRGTSIPTSTMDLGADYDSVSYSFVNYIYSNYKYIPAGSSFYISFSPTTTYSMNVTVYDASTNKALSNYNNVNLPMDAATLLKVSGLSSSKKYYVKFSSPTGNRLKGSYIVD